MLKDLPTVALSLPGYEASQWYGIAAPQKTPAEIILLLNREINASFDDAAMKARFAAISGEPLGGTPQAFDKLMSEETEKWAKVVDFAGIKID